MCVYMYLCVCMCVCQRIVMCFYLMVKNLNRDDKTVGINKVSNIEGDISLLAVCYEFGR